MNLTSGLLPNWILPQPSHHPWSRRWSRDWLSLPSRDWSLLLSTPSDPLEAREGEVQWPSWSLSSGDRRSRRSSHHRSDLWSPESGHSSHLASLAACRELLSHQVKWLNNIKKVTKIDWQKKKETESDWSNEKKWLFTSWLICRKWPYVCSGLRLVGRVLQSGLQSSSLQREGTRDWQLFLKFQSIQFN